jgi:hypothetical protein
MEVLRKDIGRDECCAKEGNRAKSGSTGRTDQHVLTEGTDVKKSLLSSISSSFISSIRSPTSLLILYVDVLDGLAYHRASLLAIRIPEGLSRRCSWIYQADNESLISVIDLIDRHRPWDSLHCVSNLVRFSSY